MFNETYHKNYIMLIYTNKDKAYDIDRKLIQTLDMESYQMSFLKTLVKAFEWVRILCKKCLELFLELMKPRR